MVRVALVGLIVATAGCGTSELGGRCAADPAACADSAAAGDSQELETSPSDSSVEDSSLADTNPEDTNLEDTNPADTTLADTVGDSGAADTFVAMDGASEAESSVDSTVDGAAPIDTAPPPDTSVADSGSAPDTTVTDSGSSDTAIAPDTADGGVDATVCTPSATSCVGKTLKSCDATGSKETLTVCGVSCTAGACVDVVNLSARGSHVCALLSNGTVSCWGHNSFGQLGNGTNTNSGKPIPVKGLTNAVQVAAGEGFTCARSADNTLRCWGWDDTGVVGDGAGAKNVNEPVLVTGKYRHVSAGAFVACGIREDERLACWGKYPGDGSTNAFAPVEITAVGFVDRVVAGGPVFARAKGGTTWKAWGENFSGELGDGTTELRVTPSSTLAEGSYFSVGRDHACAGSSGSLKCWGYNESGKCGVPLGSATKSPIAVAGLTTVRDVAAGFQHTCAVLADLTVQCWGGNTSGELGDGWKTERHSPAPVVGLSGVTQVVAGTGFTCALREDRTVRCWGRNASGELGDDTFTDSTTPVLVKW